MAKEKSAHKFNVQTLVKDLGILEASVRVGLRKHKVKKNEDGVYGWDSRAKYDEVMKNWDEKEKKPAAKKAKVKAKAPAKKKVKAKVKTRRVSAESQAEAA